MKQKLINFLDYINNNIELKKFIINLYYPDIKDFGYIYISKKKLTLLFEKQINQEFSKFCSEFNFSIKSSFQTIREVIYEVLKTQNKNLKLIGFCIYEKGKVEIIEIKKMTDYLNFIENLNTDQELNSNLSKVYFYRGQGTFDWLLQPSIFRNNNWIAFENTMIEELIRYFPNFLNDSSRIDILTKLQHYGLPTRLLDITENPLIALFFACIDADSRMEDGRIFFFRVDSNNINYSDSSKISLLSNISKMDVTFKRSDLSNLEKNSLKQGKYSNNGRLFYNYLNEENRNINFYLENNYNLDFCFLKPRYNNERIKNQSGAFIIFGMDKDKFHCPVVKDSSMNKNQIIIIDRTKKQKILDELCKINIHEGTVYPEITQVAKYIKDKYSKL